MRKVFVAALVLVATPGIAASSKSKPAIGNPGAWFGPENYPVEALRRAQQGRTIAEVGVDSGGKPVTCRIIESSGSNSLDEATCEIVLRDGHYDPATDQRGRPIPATVKLPVRWQLPEPPTDPIDVTAAPPPGQSLTLRVEVDGMGQVLACQATITPPSNYDSSSYCNPYPIGQKVTRGYVRDGRPVGATLVKRFSDEVTLDP